MQLGVHEAGGADLQHLEGRGKGEEVVQVVSGEQVEKVKKPGFTTSVATPDVYGVQQPWI